MAPKVLTIQDLYGLTTRVLKVILESDRKRDIITAFKDLADVICGQALDSFSEGLVDYDTSYESARCLVSTRTMQAIKHRHFRSRRWEYVAPLYRHVFDLLYEDIRPDTDTTDDIEESVASCNFRLPDAVWSESKRKTSVERRARPLNAKILSDYHG